MEIAEATADLRKSIAQDELRPSLEQMLSGVSTEIQQTPKGNTRDLKVKITITLMISLAPRIKYRKRVTILSSRFEIPPLDLDKIGSTKQR